MYYLVHLVAFADGSRSTLRVAPGEFMDADGRIIWKAPEGERVYAYNLVG